MSLSQPLWGSGPLLWVLLCPVTLSVLTFYARESEGACTGSAGVDRPWPTFLGRLAGQEGADGLPVVRGLPAQPLPAPKVSWAQASEPGLVLSVCPCVCVGGVEAGAGSSAPREDLPFWPRSHRATAPPAWLTPHPGPCPALTIAIKCCLPLGHSLHGV